MLRSGRRRGPDCFLEMLLRCTRVVGSTIGNSFKVRSRRCSLPQQWTHETSDPWILHACSLLWNSLVFTSFSFVLFSPAVLPQSTSAETSERNSFGSYAKHSCRLVAVDFVEITTPTIPISACILDCGSKSRSNRVYDPSTTRYTSREALFREREGKCTRPILPLVSIVAGVVALFLISIVAKYRISRCYKSILALASAVAGIVVTSVETRAACSTK